uniref:Uncharacterized protein n=1 Tax=Romanomermis culicivorax TaxID=13658 RepID=A0A915HIQ6_ROMCU
MPHLRETYYLLLLKAAALNYVIISNLFVPKADSQSGSHSIISMSSSNFLKPLNRCLNSRSYQNLESLSKKDEEEEQNSCYRKCHYPHHTRNHSHHLSVNNSTETNFNKNGKSNCKTTQPTDQKLSLPSFLPSSSQNRRSIKNPNRKFTGEYSSSNSNNKVENDRLSSTSDQHRHHKFSMVNLHKSDSDVNSQTSSINDQSSAWAQIQTEIVKAKAAAKTVSTVNGNLYIDYKFVTKLPGS